FLAVVAAAGGEGAREQGGTRGGAGVHDRDDGAGRDGGGEVAQRHTPAAAGVGADLADARAVDLDVVRLTGGQPGHREGEGVLARAASGREGGGAGGARDAGQRGDERLRVAGAAEGLQHA